MLPSFSVELQSDDVAQWADAVRRQHGVDVGVDRQRAGLQKVSTWMLGEIGVVHAKLAAVETVSVQESCPSWQGEWMYLKVVLDGLIVVDQLGEAQRHKAGSVFLLDPARRFIETTPDSVEMIVLRAPKSQLQMRGWLPALKGVSPLDVDAPDTRGIRDLVAGIAAQRRSVSPLMQRLLGNQLFDLIEIALSSSVGPSSSRGADLIVHRAKQFIKTHLGSDELNAVMVADAVNVSAKHLQRLFSEKGVSLMRYVWQCRLEHAETLLRSASSRPISVQEIAWQCGFASAAHFSRAYKARYGQPPSNAMAVSPKL